MRLKLILTFSALAGSLLAQSYVTQKQTAIQRWYQIRKTPQMMRAPSPWSMAYDGEFMWETAGTMAVKLNPSDGAVLGQLPLTTAAMPNIGVPQLLLHDGAALWVASYDHNANIGYIIHLRPTDSPATPVAIQNGGCGVINAMAYDGQNVWAACQGDNSLYTAVFQNNQIVWTKAQLMPAAPQSLLFDGTNLWISTAFSWIYKWPQGGAMTSVQIPADRGVFSLAYDGANLYASSCDTGKVYQMTAMNMVPNVVFNATSCVSASLFDSTSLWLTAPQIGAVFKLNLLNGQVVKTYAAPGPNSANALAFDGADMWVAGFGMTPPLKY